MKGKMISRARLAVGPWGPRWSHHQEDDREDLAEDRLRFHRIKFTYRAGSLHQRGGGGGSGGNAPPGTKRLKHDLGSNVNEPNWASVGRGEILGSSSISASVQTGILFWPLASCLSPSSLMQFGHLIWFQNVAVSMHISSLLDGPGCQDTCLC